MSTDNDLPRAAKMNGPTLSTFPIRVHIGEVLDPDCKAMVSLSFRGRVLARMTAGTVATFAERVSNEVALALKPLVARMFEEGAATVGKLRADTTELRHRLLAEVQRRSTKSGVVVIAVDKMELEEPDEDRGRWQPHDAIFGAQGEASAPVFVAELATNAMPSADGARDAASRANQGPSDSAPAPALVAEPVPVVPAVPASLAVGQLVHAQWTNGKFYPARIVKAQGGLYEVEWHDGSDPIWLPPDQIRLEPIASAAEGPLVSAQWSNGQYYRARVVAERDGLYEVEWEDGSAPSWVRGDQIQGEIPRLATSTPEHVVGAPHEKTRL